ncbi:MAG: hypothetical protein M0P58_10940 [Bacteroidales bacterium]|nr:hypothetical protein [Bacteroidales bacterium]
MKQIYLVVFLTTAFLTTFSQETQTEPVAKKNRRFHAGVSYNWLSNDMKLASLSLHSLLNGGDLGTIDLTDDAIDNINSYADRSNKANNVNLEFGMSFINQPQSKWRVDGTLMLGLSLSKWSVYNHNTEKEEYCFKSGTAEPTFGLRVNVGYFFTSHWGVTLQPMFVTMAGKLTEIDDNINPVPADCSQSGEVKYWSGYSRISLLGNYKAGNFTFYAGPGFHFMGSYHKYRIERLYNSNGDLFVDEITTHTYSPSVIDGTVGINWQISDLFSFNAISGLGSDFYVNAGFYVRF